MTTVLLGFFPTLRSSSHWGIGRDYAQVDGEPNIDFGKRLRTYQRWQKPVGQYCELLWFIQSLFFVQLCEFVFKGVGIRGNEFWPQSVWQSILLALKEIPTFCKCHSPSSAFQPVYQDQIRLSLLSSMLCTCVDIGLLYCIFRPFRVLNAPKVSSWKSPTKIQSASNGTCGLPSVICKGL